MSGFDILGPTQPPKTIGIQKPFGAGELRTGGGELDVESTKGDDFLSHLNDALSGVRELQLESRDQARALASGEPVEVHDMMVAMGKSEIAFNMMLEVRNKLLEAWTTLCRSVT